MIDFDEIQDWGPMLDRVLKKLVDPETAKSLQSSAPEYVDDALEILFERSDREAIIDAVLDWLRSTSVVAYHGTKLLDEDVASIQAIGLVPLVAAHRRSRLVRALSAHSRWPEIKERLDDEIRALSSGENKGGREGQVHLTLSRAALMNDFDHYLTGGSEFDQNVAHALLGEDGPVLLARDGTATLIRIIVPGAEALAAAHPYFDIATVRRQGDLPNIVKELLGAWAYRLAHPQFESRNLKPDCGLIFKAAVPPSWIGAIEKSPTAEQELGSK